MEYDDGPVKCKYYTSLHDMLIILKEKPGARGKQIWLDRDGVFSTSSAFSPCFLLDPIRSRESHHQRKILQDLSIKGKIYPSNGIFNYSFLTNWHMIMA